MSYDLRIHIKPNDLIFLKLLNPFESKKHILKLKIKVLQKLT